jgi:hypothetical protein
MYRSWVMLVLVAGIYSLLLVPPAGAHNSCVAHGDDVGCTRADNGDPHFWVDACDRESDGNRVRARIDGSGLSGETPGNWDPNGANPGCANDISAGLGLYYHKICEENVGCSDPRYH